MAGHAGAPGDETLAELEGVLCLIAGGVLPDRAEAIVYSRCRSDLLQSAVKELLPGFIYQCPTVFKFREFITLYDPDTGLREAFVRRAFERCRGMLAQHYRPRPAEPATQRANPPRPRDDFDPQRWMS